MEVSWAVAELRVPPLLPAAPSPPLGAMAAAAVQMSAVPPAAASRFPYVLPFFRPTPLLHQYKTQILRFLALTGRLLLRWRLL